MMEVFQTLGSSVMRPAKTCARGVFDYFNLAHEAAGMRHLKLMQRTTPKCVSGPYLEGDKCSVSSGRSLAYQPQAHKK